jgi:hypothetical protein
MKKLLLVSLLVFGLVGLTMAQGGGATATGAPAQRGAGGGGGRGGGMQTPPATGPIADLATAGIDAINKGDATFFEKRLAADVVWFDEDGHGIAGKERVLGFVKSKLLTGAKKVTMSGLRVGENWAGYVYTIEAGTAKREGTQTIVYKKVGNDYEIVMVHGAVKAAGHM